MTFVKSDLEYHRAEHQIRRKEFYDAFNEFLEDSSFEFSEEKTVKNMIDVYKKERLVPTPRLGKESKKLFKEIAKKTHPDVTKDDEIKGEMFKAARQALEEDDWYTVYDIASRLNIELPKPSKEHVEWLEQEVLKMERIIQGIRETFEWKYCEPNSNKQQLLTTYCMITCNKK